MVDFTDVGPSPDNFVGANAVRGGSGRILSLAAAADGRRLYAGSYAGVWRSDDAGRNWRQMTRPQPATFNAEVPGALFAPYVVDLAVSPGDANLVIAAAESSLFAPFNHATASIAARTAGRRGVSCRRCLPPRRQPGRLRAR